MTPKQKQAINAHLQRLRTQMEDLRLMVKIQTHDLEATRRERDYCRKLLNMPKGDDKWGE